MVPLNLPDYPETLQMLQNFLNELERILIEDAENKPRLEEILSKWGNTPEIKGFTQQKSHLVIPIFKEMVFPIVDYLSESNKVEFCKWAIDQAISSGYLFYYIGFESAATRMPLKITASLHDTLSRRVCSNYESKLKIFQETGAISEEIIEQTTVGVRAQVDKFGNDFIHLGIENFPMLSRKKWGIFKYFQK